MKSEMMAFESIMNIVDASVTFVCEREGKTRVSYIVDMFTVNLIVFKLMHNP